MRTLLFAVLLAFSTGSFAASYHYYHHHHCGYGSYNAAPVERCYYDQYSGTICNRYYPRYPHTYFYYAPGDRCGCYNHRYYDYR